MCRGPGGSGAGSARPSPWVHGQWREPQVQEKQQEERESGVVSQLTGGLLARFSENHQQSFFTQKFRGDPQGRGLLLSSDHLLLPVMRANSSGLQMHVSPNAISISSVCTLTHHAQGLGHHRSIGAEGPTISSSSLRPRDAGPAPTTRQPGEAPPGSPAGASAVTLADSPGFSQTRLEWGEGVAQVIRQRGNLSSHGRDHPGSPKPSSPLRGGLLH